MPTCWGSSDNDRTAAPRARTGSVTIPQIFVGGQFLGGAADVFDAYKEGRLQELLVQNGVPFEASVVDPDALLPNWLQDRGRAKPSVCAVPRG